MTVHPFIQKIKESNASIINKFITEDEVRINNSKIIEKQKLEEKIKWAKLFLDKKVVKILVQDLEKNTVSNIFNCYCLVEDNSISFSPERNSDDTNYSPTFIGSIQNIENLKTDFTLPGSGLNDIWHITPLY